MNKELYKYIEEQIFPQYRSFDPAHREEHVLELIRGSLLLASHYSVVTREMFEREWGA